MGENLQVLSGAGYESIRKKIDAYKTEMQALIESEYTVRDSLSRYVGMGKVQKSPLHRQLYDDVAQEVKVLVEELSQVPDEWMAARAASTILNYGREADAQTNDSVRLALMSIEALVIPLLDYMDSAEIEALRSIYEKKYSKKNMLPKQKELYRKMCGHTGCAERTGRTERTGRIEHTDRTERTDRKSSGKTFGFWRR